MTGYQSKKAAARDKLDSMERKRGSIALARSLCYQINGAADDSDDMDGGGYGSVDVAEILSAEVVRLQAALAQPAQRPWVGLTEEDFSAINQSCFTKLQAATSAELILKEKNNG